MTSSNGNIIRVNGHLCGEFTDPGEFPTQRPVTWSFDVYLYLRLNKRLCKQSWGWWLETLLCPLLRHSTVHPYIHDKVIECKYMWCCLFHRTVLCSMSSKNTVVKHYCFAVYLQSKRRKMYLIRIQYVVRFPKYWIWGWFIGNGAGIWC